MISRPYQKITYWQAVKRFNTNAKLYLIYSTMSGINSAIFLVAFAFYLEEIFADGANLLGTRVGTFAFIGLALSAQALAHGANSIPSGFIGDKYGRKRSFIAASVVSVLAGALVLGIRDPLLLLVLAIVVGVGEAFHGVVGAPFMMENSREEERMHLFSLAAALSVISAVIGASLGGLLPSLLQNWVVDGGRESLGVLGFGSDRAIALRLTLLMSVPFGLVELIPLFFMKESYSKVLIPLSQVFMLKHVDNKKTVGKLFMISLLYAAGLGIYFPLLNLHFEHSFHVHAEEFGPIVALNNLAITIATFAVPLMVLRFGRLRTIVMTRLLATPFLISLAFSPNIFVATLLFILRGALATMAMPVSSAFSMEVVDDNERATTAGFTHMAFDVFYGAMIFVGGLLLSFGSFWTTFIVASILYVSHALIFWIFFHEHPVTKTEKDLQLRQSLLKV